MGRLIPAGTGFTAYEGLAVNRQDEENEELAPPIAT
jgi:hypothetical protein